MSLATNEVKDAPLSVDTGAGKSVGVTENLSQTLGGTEGATQYFFKVALPQITMNSGTTGLTNTDATPAGTVLTTIALDGSFDEQIVALKKKFMYWSLKDLTFILKCISPWSSASGTAQVYYNLDPENPFSGSAAETLMQCVRLAKSQQVSAKTDCVLQIPDSELIDPVTGSKFRWCKTATASYPRLERFGELGVVVRGSPALGDGSSWAVTLEGLASFTKPTANADIAQYRLPYMIDNTGMGPPEIDIQPSAINVIVNIADKAPPNTVGTVTNRDLSYLTLQLGEAGTTDILETYNIALNCGSYSADENGSCVAKFPTLISSRTQIGDIELIGYKTVPMSGDFVYVVDNPAFSTVLGSLRGSQIAAFPVGKHPQSYLQRLRNACDYGLIRFLKRSGPVEYSEVGGSLQQVGNVAGPSK